METRHIATIIFLNFSMVLVMVAEHVFENKVPFETMVQTVLIAISAQVIIFGTAHFFESRKVTVSSRRR